jgi:xanthine dehydrogenase accessory factor
MQQRSNPSDGQTFRTDAIEWAASWLEEHGRVVLATVIETWGSSPVPVGGQMVVAPSQHFAGSVSGGCVEADVVAEAMELMPGGLTRTLSFGVADATAWDAGLPCGGAIRILLEPMTAAKDGADIARILAARRQRRPMAVATALGDGARSLVELGNAQIPPVLARCLKDATSRIVAGDTGEVFVHAHVPPARLIVVGATHIAQVLALLARVAGYEMVVVDPRPAFASPARFPGVAVVAEWPQDALPRLGLDDATAVVVVAHAAHIDDAALVCALRSHCRYVGALGSRRNHAKRSARLAAAGMAPEDVARIRAPIGLDIGARTPAEIALSIMAEVVSAFRGPKGGEVSAPSTPR